MWPALVRLIAQQVALELAQAAIRFLEQRLKNEPPKP